MEDEMRVRAMRASFCMTACSDVAMVTKKEVPPPPTMHFMTCDDLECLISHDSSLVASPLTPAWSTSPQNSTNLEMNPVFVPNDLAADSRKCILYRFKRNIPLSDEYR